MLLGGALGGKAAVRTARKALTKESAEKLPLFQGLTPDQGDLLLRKINSPVTPHHQVSYLYKDIADLRKAGISMEDIGKAFRLPYVRTKLKQLFEDNFQQMEKVKKLLRQG